MRLATAINSPTRGASRTTRKLTLPNHDKMKFEATEEQIKQIGINAIKASKPAMFGYLGTESIKRPVTLDDLNIDENGLRIDYFRGKMVKLFVRKETEDQWELNDSVEFEYQSWISVYPTAKALVESVLGAST